MKKCIMKRWLSIILAVIMIFSSSAYDFSGVVNTYAAEKVELTEETKDNSLDAASENGLADSVEDGVILHAWDWSFKQIKSELDDIAAAGYTAVQTSPIQPNKEGANVPNTGAWWKFYQPVDFTVCENQYGKVNKLGTKEDFISLCNEAHKRGIKIIVDVVANHMANSSGDGMQNTKEKRSAEIPGYLKDNEGFWRINGYSGSSDENRKQMTQGPIGMPDLNTHNEDLQNIIIKFLEEALDCGADGFRFDAAKHIETPDDGDFSSQFWPRVTAAAKAKNPNVFIYGEILNTAGPGHLSDTKKYTKYIRVTNNWYANYVRSGIGSRDATQAKTLHGYDDKGNNIFGSDGNEWVLWNESHDTYAGDYGEHTDAGFDDEEMALAWCAVAARYPTALYFSRPIPQKGDGAWGSAALGQHTNMYKNERIAAMNKFHNYFAGQTEYAEVADNVLVVERGTTGVALVNFGRGGKSVNIKMNKVVDGTYKDQVTGNEFKVSGGQLTGSIGSGGVAVIYNATPPVKKPTPTISRESGDFSGDTLKLTIGLKNAISGTYKIGNAAAETYTSEKEITIGSDMAFGDSVKIVLTATDGTTTETKECIFTKVDKVVNKAYLSKPSDWPDTVYCYAYDSATEKINNAEWPGLQMTKDSETGYYVYEVPENIEKPRVIFNCGKDDEVHRDPANEEDGFLFETDGSWLYENGSWKKYSSPVTDEGKVIVKYVDGSGGKVAEPKTMTGKVGQSYTTSAETVNGYTLKTTPANASGKYTKEDITVTYIYEKISDDTITITSSLAEGATFETETEKITLTIANATSGTYSVDNGPVKTFAGNADVIIGQGKIADTKVTVDVTATNGTDTVTKTFTYNKKFSGKTVLEKMSAASALAASMELSTAGNQFASEYYKTNPSGRGTMKTITGASDWTAAELIAQGAANDDSNVLRGPHEYPVYDTYALYGAYDDDNVYLGWQFVNVRDVVAKDQQGAGTNEAKPYNANIPQMLVFDLGSSKGAYSDGSMDEEGNIWNIGVNFKTNVNALMCFDSKPGCGDPALFTTNSNGQFSYDKEYCKLFKGIGVTYKWEDGLFAGINSLYGIDKNGHNGLTSDMFLSNSSDWEDLLAKGHTSSLDTMYTITIPYSAFGITKEYIQSTGIGVMHISTYGLSGVASIPADETMYDNAAGESKYGDNTTLEKEDVDEITAPLARLGGSGDTPTPIPEDLAVNFGADRSSPQLDTTKLTLKAIPKGGKSPYKYEFFVDGRSVQSESATDSYIWSPIEGDHSISVKVTDSNNKSVSSQKSYMIEGEGTYTPPTVTAFSTDKESAKEGDSVRLTASATGGEGALQYKFTATDAAGSKTVIRDYDASASVDWMPSEGIYKLEVIVKDGRDKEAAKTILQFIVSEKPSQEPVVKSISTDKESATEGDTVKISAVAEGKGELQYRFTVTAEGGEEKQIQDFSTSNEFNWTAAEPGTYTLTAYVKDSDGKTAKKIKAGFAVNKSGSESEIAINSFAADKASGTVKAGESIELSVDVTANVEVTYKFAVSFKDKITVISEFGDAKKATWSPQEAGTYDLYVYVKDAKGYTVTKDILGYVVNTKDNPVTLEVKDISTNKESVTEGDTVKITADATGAGELQYRFTAAAAGGEEKQIQDFGTSNECNWKATEPGTYTLTAYVKDSSGKTAQKSKAGFVVKSKDTPITLEVKSFAADKISGTVYEGTTIKLSATAVGTGELKYRFAATANGSKENLIQDYSTSNKCDWNPSAGIYKLSVSVKDSNGNIVTQDILDYKVNAKNEEIDLQIISLSADKDSAVEGDTVKLLATAVGMGELQYKFTVFANGAEETLQEYSTSNVCNWKPYASGTYTLAVYVKDSKGNQLKKSKSGFVVNKKTYQHTIKINSFNADKESGTVKPGDSIKLSADVTSDTAVKYKFMAVSGDNEIVISDYSDNSTVTWKPQSSGEYSLIVLVKNTNDDVESSSIEGYRVKSDDTPVVEKISITSFRLNKASKYVTAGQTIKMSAKATGGNGTLQYKFAVKLGENEVQTVKDFSADSTCEWKPDKSGNYTVYVYVKDGSNSETAEKSISNYTVKSALKIKSFTQSKKSNKAVAGDKVILKVSASGGVGQKLYRYYYKLNGKKYMIRNYTTSKKINWIPKKAGKYQLYVQVTDDSDNRVTKKVNYVVKSKLKVKSFKANKKTVKAGQKIRLSVVATGGKKGYSYKFVYKYKNKSVVIKKYSRSSKIYWKPAKKGTYEVKVYVMDANKKKATKTIKIKVK